MSRIPDYMAGRYFHIEDVKNLTQDDLDKLKALDSEEDLSDCQPCTRTVFVRRVAAETLISSTSFDTIDGRSTLDVEL